MPMAVSVTIVRRTLQSRLCSAARRCNSSARTLLLVGLLLATATSSHAVLPDEILKDARLEMRARALSQNLRCLVCQNQSIDDSDAPLARDLRVLVRERLTAGDTDAQAMDYIVARYGTFVLLKPPMQSNTLLLWLMPLLLLAGAVIGFRRHLRARAGASTLTPDLTSDEARRLEALLENKGRG
jgi:cytochrome c-type biogenesis protein CcmH